VKLVVCGCSWSSIDNTAPETEFGSLIASHFNFDEYNNLATVGASNFVIRSQIDHACTLSPDLVVVNWTTPSRTEWAKSEQQFNFAQPLANFDYSINPKAINSEHPLGSSTIPNWYFNSLTSILDEENYKGWLSSSLAEKGLSVSEEQFNTIKKYFIHWYREDLEVAKQISYVKSAMYDLDRHRIPYLMSLNTMLYLQLTNDNLFDLSNTIDPIPESNRIDGVAGMLKLYDTEIKGWTNYADNPGSKLDYHISPEAQQYYFENFIREKVSNILLSS
jgi:hypothetical protein